MYEKQIDKSEENFFVNTTSLMNFFNVIQNTKALNC
jgi:hypothetical protein